MMQSRVDGPIIQEMPDSPPRPRVLQTSQTMNIQGVSNEIQQKLIQLVRNPEIKSNPSLMEKCILILKEMREQRCDYLEYNHLNTQDDQIIMDLNNRIYRYTEQLRRAEEEYYSRRERSSLRFEDTRRRNTHEFDSMNIDNRENTHLSHNRSEKQRQRYTPVSDDSDNEEQDRRAHSSNQSRNIQQQSMSRTMDSNRDVRPKSNQQRVIRGKNSISKTKNRRFRPGQKALQEIRKYQKSTDLLIQRAPFRRLVVEIMRDTASRDYRISGDALNALQEAAEVFLVDMFEKSTLLSHHAKRVTLMPADIILYRRLCYQ